LDSHRIGNGGFVRIPATAGSSSKSGQFSRESIHRTLVSDTSRKKGLILAMAQCKRKAEMSPIAQSRNVTIGAGGSKA
jgi:hypothetical protein